METKEIKLTERRTEMKSKEYPIHKNVFKRFLEKDTLTLYTKLIEEKLKIQNRPQESKQALSSLGGEKGGDQADQVNRLLEEVQYTSHIQKDNLKLKQIIQALARMESGDYGICEETEEVIKVERLLSLPWTTLSIEGAEELEKNPVFKAKAR